MITATTDDDTGARSRVEAVATFDELPRDVHGMVAAILGDDDVAKLAGASKSAKEAYGQIATERIEARAAFYARALREAKGAFERAAELFRDYNFEPEENGYWSGEEIGWFKTNVIENWFREETEKMNFENEYGATFEVVGAQEVDFFGRFECSYADPHEYVIRVSIESLDVEIYVYCAKLEMCDVRVGTQSLRKLLGHETRPRASSAGEEAFFGAMDRLGWNFFDLMEIPEKREDDTPSDSDESEERS